MAARSSKVSNKTSNSNCSLIDKMGQLQTTSHETSRDTPRDMLYDTSDDTSMENNGHILSGNYMPDELLSDIFCRLNHKELLTCQLVCKRWRELIQNYIWRKKAEMTMSKPLPRNSRLHWRSYYKICEKRPFEKNLVKNHSGQYSHDYWQIINQGGDRWKIEDPPLGVPDLPLTDPVFEGKQICFATSYYNCSKSQKVDLITEGLSPFILDVLKPPIEVSEWYSCRWDCPAIYECTINLLGYNSNNQDVVLDTFHFRDIMEGKKQNQWLRVSHVFEDYKPGLRKIYFCHSGMDQSFWAGHYGSKMAGACIYVKVPSAPQGTSMDYRNTLPFVDE